MNKAKYFGVTVDGKHLLKDLNNGQIEIYETEGDAKTGDREAHSYVIPVYVSKEPDKELLKVLDGYPHDVHCDVNDLHAHLFPETRKPCNCWRSELPRPDGN